MFFVPFLCHCVRLCGCVCVCMFVRLFERVSEIFNEYIISIGSKKVYESRPSQRINLIISSLDWVFVHFGDVSAAFSCERMG